MVGVVGIEPTAPNSQSSGSATELHPAYVLQISE
jgi:hypothetical protein